MDSGTVTWIAVVMFPDSYHDGLRLFMRIKDYAYDIAYYSIVDECKTVYKETAKIPELRACEVSLANSNLNHPMRTATICPKNTL